MLNKGYSSSSNKEMKNHRKRNVFKNTLDRDIYAMKKVLKMLQEGFFTWIGELGSGKY
tara:strand:- start:1919 stop:2092 length:174 start_codon:yes stop_codon:yes gene_type:complete